MSKPFAAYTNKGPDLSAYTSGPVKPQPSNALLKLENATRMLAEVRSAPEAKKLMDMAAAAEHYAKKAKLGNEAIQYAHEIKVDAETLLGEFLETSDKNSGAKGSIVSGNKRVPLKDSAPTLADLGLTKKESSEAQMLARVKREAPEQHAAVRSRKKSKVQVSRELRETKRESKRQENARKVEAATKPEDLAGRFSTIVIDPPWDWGDEGDVNQLGRAKPDFAAMSLEQLEALPVGKLSDNDCHLYLWITARSLPKGFQLIDAWGFRYITALVWPKSSFGMGNYFRGQTEFVLFGVRGSLPLKRKNASTLLPVWKRGKGHSAKPIEFGAFVESCSPGPYLEMFSRVNRKGWTQWGEDSK